MLSTVLSPFHMHWRLQSPNSVTVAVLGDCHQIQRQIVAVSGDFGDSRQCGQGFTEENANVSFLRQTMRRALVALRSVIH